MTPLLTAALEIDQFLDSQGWEYCVIGGLAAMRWGKPRATDDVDLTLLTGFGDEQQYLEPLLLRFRARVEDPVTFTLQNRVAVLVASNGVAVDISFGAVPFELEVIRRATPFEYEPGVQLRTASAEDLLVMKSLAGRPQDLFDVEGIVVRQWDHLDWEFVFRQLEALAEYFPASDAAVRLHALRHEVSGQFGSPKTRRRTVSPRKSSRGKRPRKP